MIRTITVEFTADIEGDEDDMEELKSFHAFVNCLLEITNGSTIYEAEITQAT
jgi:hypothetical protein